jgi:acyl-CoA synthetase (AMP-forming)/AMP-acid ligase II
MRAELPTRPQRRSNERRNLASWKLPKPWPTISRNVRIWNSKYPSLRSLDAKMALVTLRSSQPGRSTALQTEQPCYLSGKELTALSEENAVTVALLGQGSVQFVATFLALPKLGYTVFLMPPRLSASTIVGLLAKTECRLVMFT